MNGRTVAPAMRVLVPALLLLASLVVLAPGASASGDCDPKEVGGTPYEVYVYRGDCLRVTYDHPTAHCSGHVDGPIYSGTVVCNGRLVLW